MSDNATEDEPTMEEILASIRRIISDDSEEEAAAESAEEEAVPEEEPAEEVPEVEAAPEPTPAEPAPEPEPEEEQPEIEAVAEDPEPAPEPEPVPAPAPVEEAEPEDDVFELTDFAQDPEPEPIVSEPIETRAAESFDHLTQMMVSGYAGADNTLEALVRSMLKPMLQDWLDNNLPTIVQDAVEREVARISRRK